MASLSEKTKARLDEILAKAVAEGKLPGASYTVGTADKELYHGNAGLRSFQEPSLGKIDDESVFWICSMTKVVATIAILQLLEKGTLTYDTPVAQYVPELAAPLVVDDILAAPAERTYRPAQNKILIRHILNHTSGLAYALAGRVTADDLPEGYTDAPYEGDYSVPKFFEVLRAGLPAVPLAFEPGTSWAYGWGCDIIGFIVERITGKSLEEYCKENIFDPVGVEMTFNPTPEMKDRLVQLTYREKDYTLHTWAGQLGIIEPDPSKLNLLLGGIGIYSTVRDYLTFLRHILAAQAGKASNPVLSVESIANMFRPTVVESAITNIEAFTKWDYLQFGEGLCLSTRDWPGRRKQGSGFWYGWAGTYYFLDPTTGIAVVLGTQVVPSSDPEVLKLWKELEEALYAGIEA